MKRVSFCIYEPCFHFVYTKEVLCSGYEMAIGVDRQEGGGDFTLRSDLAIGILLLGSKGILLHSKTRAVNVCETGILP